MPNEISTVISIAAERNLAAHIERDDVLAFLREEWRRHERALRGIGADKTELLAKIRSKAGLISTMIAYIERGDHVGAATRKEDP